MQAIIHAILVLGDHYLPNATILVDEGKIIDFGEKLSVPEGAEIIDAERLYVGPGLVDIHTHSDGDNWFYESPEIASAKLLKHGVTSVLPALYFNLSMEEYLSAIRTIEKARREGKASNVQGYYMEGPYLNPKYGCDREKNQWKGSIDPAKYRPILDEVGDKAKVWCVAPEREGIEDFVREVKEKNPAAVFSVAHSEAMPDDIERLMPYGLRIATHHTNATGSPVRYPECHGIGVDETVWKNDSLYAELICDSRGIHVDPYMLRLIRQIKGRDRIILIADAFVSDGPVPPGYEGVTDINFDWEGEIAGSRMTLDIACQNMLKHTGASVCDIFRFASYNPARAANIQGAGEIRRGAPADLIFVDHLFQVHHTMKKGEIIE